MLRGKKDVIIAKSLSLMMGSLVPAATGNYDVFLEAGKVRKDILNSLFHRNVLERKSAYL